MGYIWNKATRMPENSTTHLMIFGKVGTGPDSIVFKGNTSMRWFNTKRLLGTFGTVNLRNEMIDNVVAKGDYAWAIGNPDFELVGNPDTAIKKQFFVNMHYVDGQYNLGWLPEFNSLPNYSTGVPCQFVRPIVYDTAHWEISRNIDFERMCAGADHFLAFSGNTLYAWGSNIHNQCNVPSNVHSSLLKVSAGNGFSIALLNNGSLTGWGLNNKGQISIPAGVTATKIESGMDHTVALKADGTIVCWGGNSYGQTTVPAGLTGVTAIGAGSYHSMAIRENGTVVCWGLNDYGQCNVPAGATYGKQIAGGLKHTVLLKQNGTLIGWGDNTYLQASGPANPEPLIEGHMAGNEFFPYVHQFNLPGSIKKIACSSEATFALHTGFCNLGQVTWAGNPSLGITHWVQVILPIAGVKGITTSAYPSGSCFYVKFEGYSGARHDLFIYPEEPSLTNPSIKPIGYNTNWWSIGSSSEKKLNKCFISGYDRDGIYKVYDSNFSPPDLSGCSIRPRQLGAPWIGGELTSNTLNNPINDWGYVGLYEPNLWQLSNSGFWCNVLISKKHAIASKHFSGPNVNLYNVQWLRRDGVFITRNLTRVSDLRFTYSDGRTESPDVVLYELDQALTTDDLKNISVYNVLPKLSGMTGSKLINTNLYLWKGYTYNFADIPYSDKRFLETVGRRLWYLDGNSKVYSYVITGIQGITNSNVVKYTTNRAVPATTTWTPDDVNCVNFKGDSGTPVFMTAANYSNKTESREAVYFEGQGTTWGRTFFLGLFDAFTGEWGDEFVQKINQILITSGLTGNDLLQKIDVASSTPPLPWTAPVGSPSGSGQPLNSINSDVGALSVDPSLQTDYVVGQATVSGWDSKNKILTLSGVTGSFFSAVTGGNYYIENLNDPDVAYSSIIPVIVPINNGIGTTAGSNDILNTEAEEYIFDPNNPF